MLPVSKIKPLAIILVPLILLPIPLILQDDVATFAYCLLIVALFWVFELTNIFVTSLLPMVLLPLAGVSDPATLSKQYMPDVCMLFIGTLILASAIENTGVHKRIALGTLRIFGRDMRTLMLGLMLVTWFMSMWISNTATTALMLPIIEAIFSVYEDSTDQPEITEDTEDKPKPTLPANITKGLTLAIAAAANIGGTATLTGTPPNLVCASVMQDLFPCYQPKLSFANWIIYGIPLSTSLVIFAYIFLNIYWFGFPFFQRGHTNKYQKFSGDNIQKVINQQYQDLPNLKFNEIYVVFTLISMVTLWFFKSPGFITGWADLYPDNNKPSDSTVAIFFSILLFIVPNTIPEEYEKSYIKILKNPIKFYKQLNFKEPILKWRHFEENCPWGTILLIGAGIALSRASEDSGFSQFIADLLTGLDVLEPYLILIIVVTFVIFLTEITSNTATSNLILPILANLAKSINMNPLFLTIPATFACTMAFMLPVATGVNALCFSYGRLTIPDMIKCGIFLNILGIFIISLFGLSYSDVIFHTKDSNQTWIYEPENC